MKAPIVLFCMALILSSCEERASPCAGQQGYVIKHWLQNARGYVETCESPVGSSGVSNSVTSANRR